METPIETSTVGIVEDMREVRMVLIGHVSKTSPLASYHGHIVDITDQHTRPGRQPEPSLNQVS